VQVPAWASPTPEKLAAIQNFPVASRGMPECHARKRKLGEPFSSVNVKLGGCGSALSYHVRSEEQENDAYDEFH
jgi:hypothetical protein